jgi:hypothetical protein
MALGLSSTLSFCVVVNVPFLTIQVWGRFTASHFRQSDGQTMNAQMHTHTHKCVLIHMLGIVSRSGVLGPVLVNSLLCQLDLVFR